MPAKKRSKKESTLSLNETRESQPAAEYRLVEGTVDPANEYIGLHIGNDEQTVVRVAPGPDNTFIVQNLVETDLFNKDNGSFKKVQQELTFYLLEHGPQSVFGDPWEYAKYHCGTAANIYSSVHWSWYPDKSVSRAEKQQHAMNKKKVYICPKCDSKFIVTGNVPITCPECKKAELVPLSMSRAKQVEQIDIEFCPICHDGVPDVDMIVPGDCFHQCMSCKKVSIGKPGITACQFCGHKNLVESYNVWPVEKVCKKCRDESPDMIKDVEDGGVYFVCSDCGNYSALAPSKWTATMRKDMGRKKKGWAQAYITYNQCPSCNPLVIDGDYKVRKNGVVFKGLSPDRYKVVYGRVTKSSEHIVVTHADITKKDKRVPLARLAPGEERNIRIQYLVPECPDENTAADRMSEVKLAIQRVAQGVKTNPWPQMKKLAATPVKTRSKVYWELVKGTESRKKVAEKTPNRSRKG